MSAQTSGSPAQVARLLLLVPLLHAEGEIALEDAAVRLGVTPAQVVKDLQVLWMCGLPGGLPDELIDIDMEAVTQDGVIRISNADYLARPMRLSATEGSALVLALRSMAEDAPADNRAVIDRVLTKLGAAVEDSRAAFTDAADAQTSTREGLDRALAAGTQVEIDYWVPTRDEVTTRRVDPIGIHTWDNLSYLQAWCHRAGDERLFRLDRIQGLRPTDEPVTGQRAEAGASPTVAPGEFASRGHEVTLELDPEAAWIAEYYPVAEVVPAPDAAPGTLLVRLPVVDAAWLRRLLLRVAPHGRVRGEEEFTDSLIAEATRARALYGPRGVG